MGTHAEVVREKTLRVLREMQELLSDPKRWTKNASARDANGDCVVADSPLAKSYCLSGALRRTCCQLPLSYNLRQSVIARAEHTLIHASRKLRDTIFGYVSFNDHELTTHEDVMLALKHAIHELESKS